jgi:hypothetical protein
VCKTEPHPGLHADLRIAGIISVHEIVPKHQPEVTGMVKSEGDKSVTQRSYVSSDIVRVPDFLDVSAKPFKCQKSNFGEESFRAPEVMRRSSRRHACALSGCANREGFKVAATARTLADVADLTERFGDAVLPLALDVTDADQARHAVRQAHAHFGKLDVVLNNAGYTLVGTVEEALPVRPGLPAPGQPPGNAVCRSAELFEP